jgi:Phage tail assembly chaperone proteins, E, or 41 or 14
MKLLLKHPITIGTTVVAELTLRDHTIAEDYLAFDQRGGVAQRIALIASVAGTDEALIKKLHGVDYQRAEREVDRMLRDDEAHAEDGADTAKAVEKK